MIDIAEKYSFCSFPSTLRVFYTFGDAPAVSRIWDAADQK
jgi:hypothetical protein